MAVNRHQLMDEIELKLSNDEEAEDNFADFADYVVRTWQRIATEELDAGYATGTYVSSIHRKSVRATRAEGGNRGGWRTTVLTESDIAHFLEYGTVADHAPNYPQPPKAGGHWTDPQGGFHVWWNTPTPVFALAARTEDDVAATESALPMSRSAQQRVKLGTARKTSVRKSTVKPRNRNARNVPKPRLSDD